MESIKESYHKYLRYFLAKDDATATSYDKYMALSYAVRSAMVDRWIDTQRTYHDSKARRVYFLSMEYVFGRSLKQNILSLDMEESTAALAQELQFDLEEIYAQEDSFDLGNGGKARLAACQLDAMASAALPAMAYGLRYDFGQFRQAIEDGVQVEKPYDWLHKGHPWEIIRPEYSCEIEFYGTTAAIDNSENPLARKWIETEKVVAVPYDFPVPGFKNDTVNTLRLWVARASEAFLPDYSNHGDYLRACEDKSRSGTITKVLFPDEDVLRATELRLKQQFFLASASLQDIIRRFKKDHNGVLLELSEKVVIQLSGSNCALAVPELLRLLVDIEGIPWEKAWHIACGVFAYTSNAVSREHLESWPVYLMTQIFPRHMQIIYEMNQLHLDNARKNQGAGEELVRDLSLIAEGEVRRVKLGHLATLGSSVVNGVSAAQTEILTKSVFPEFMTVSPEKFQTKTNGVSHRRWLLCANRPLGNLITDAIGEKWIKQPDMLSALEPFATNSTFLDKMRKVRFEAKKSLAAYIKEATGVSVDADAMFDVQCKKIHQYKRQVLHVLFVIARYLQIKRGEKPGSRRVHIFAGKAAPSDQLAKQIIRLITFAGEIVNNDPDVKDALKVVLLPDYGVTLAERIIPASDLSEQIATPGQEASGTGNAKFAINGGLLMASKSGTNLEIVERVGADNVFLFGRSSQELPSHNSYQAYDVLSANATLTAIFKFLNTRLDSLSHNAICIRPLLSTLMDSDRYFVLLDFDDYLQKQSDADALFGDSAAWAAKGVVNIARSGYFSIDRTIKQYAADIWKASL